MISQGEMMLAGPKEEMGKKQTQTHSLKDGDWEH